MKPIGFKGLITAEQYAKSRNVTVQMVLQALRKGHLSSTVVFAGDDETQMLQDPISHDSFRVLRPSKGLDNNWHVTDDGDTMVAHCYGFEHDIPSGEIFARRIVACLNFCKGLDNETLESFVRAGT